ncbi:expressed unknown protein [Seminavis robusta]|uniref:Uncharacterized protein n=1 Tax=Seminavis robusta TaxID=568900 RepID=A0A9N8HX88_9STRA|nr:expressed unknown protein [Seminavis robusta]|eukprot:Sro2979_g341470.1 n/a (267) ;mRNA; f:6297-7097
MDHETEAISFFVATEPRTFRPNEPARLGWERHIIYKNRRWPNHLGYGAAMIFLKLSDGRIVLTNDLWAGGTSDSQNYIVAQLPPNALIGVILSETRICQPKTKAALQGLLELLKRPLDPIIHVHSVWRTKTGLTDEQAWDLAGPGPQSTKIVGKKKAGKNKQTLPQLPQVTRRTHQGQHMQSTFYSPENAILTHIKLPGRNIQPFLGPEQLQGLDPSTSPIFVLYRSGDTDDGLLGGTRRGLGLQNGDTIDETYVYELEDWTGHHS